MTECAYVVRAVDARRRVLLEAPWPSEPDAECLVQWLAGLRAGEPEAVAAHLYRADAPPHTAARVSAFVVEEGFGARD